MTAFLKVSRRHPGGSETPPSSKRHRQGQLVPYLKGFRATTSSAETFSEIVNKFRSGYSLRDALEIIDQLDFGSRSARHETCELYETCIKRMGTAGIGAQTRATLTAATPSCCDWRRWATMSAGSRTCSARSTRRTATSSMSPPTTASPSFRSPGPLARRRRAQLVCTAKAGEAPFPRLGSPRP